MGARPAWAAEQERTEWVGLSKASPRSGSTSSPGHHGTKNLSDHCGSLKGLTRQKLSQQAEEAKGQRTQFQMIQRISSMSVITNYWPTLYLANKLGVGVGWLVVVLFSFKK